MKRLEQAINGYGPYFRVLTPVLCMFITVLVTIMLFTIKGINSKVMTLDKHFTNHLMHHQDLEVGYANRISAIEGNRFTAKDGVDLERRVDHKLENTKRVLRALELKVK